MTDLFDATETLDRWHDERRGYDVSLHPLVGDLRGTGFAAVARSAGGELRFARIIAVRQGEVRALTSREIGALRRKGPRSWGGLLGRLAGALFVVLVVGCASPTPTLTPAAPSPTPTVIWGCELLVPRELPSGAAPGPLLVLGPGAFGWGIGTDRMGDWHPDALTLEVGKFGVEDWAYWLDPPDVREGHPQRVEVRGVDAFVYLVGDDGVGSIGIIWQRGDCPYTLWLADGTTVAEAADYAVRF